MRLGKFVDNGNTWGHPHKAVDVLCPDGKRRTVRLNQRADTYFSWPGRATIAGRSVRGYVTGRDTDDGLHDLEFRPYAD